MGQVVFDKITKRFGDVTAVDELSLDVPPGELLVLLGPSGCGKTTALRLVAGLETADSGTVTLAGRVVNDIEPKDRDVAMVFQSYALYPHLSVAKNLEFPLRQRHLERVERERRVREVAETLGLADLLGRKPGQLSGGQRQRVALGRAIVRSPEVFLMDEPLSNLDAALRVQTRADIVALQQRLATTTLYVTHDQVEAMTMGHRIAVMQSGVLQQVATPHELYNRPANTFVASFLGSPGMNLMEGRVGEDDRAVVSGGSVALPAGLAEAGRRCSGVTVGVRPEGLRVDPAGSLDLTVRLVEQLGAEAHLVCRMPDDTPVVIRQGMDVVLPRLGEALRAEADPGAVHLFEATSGERLMVTG